MADSPESRRRNFRVVSCSLAVGETGEEPAAAQEKGDYTLEELTEMALQTLPQRQQEALRLLYGIGRQKEPLLRKAAAELGTTAERIRHLQAKGFGAVRHLLYSGGTRPSASPPAAPGSGYGLALYRKLANRLSSLPPLEERVLRMRSGFGYPSPMSVAAASAASGLDPAELRAAEKRAKGMLSGEAAFLLQIFGPNAPGP